MKSQKIAILEKARITFYSWWISDAYTNTNHSSSSVKGTSIYTHIHREDAQKIDRRGLVCRASSWFSARLVVMTIRNNFCVLVCHRPLIRHRSSSHGWQNICLDNLFQLSNTFSSDPIILSAMKRALDVKNFRGEMLHTFAEVRWNSSFVYLSSPHQLLTEEASALFVARIE